MGGSVYASEIDGSITRRITPHDGQLFSWLQHGLLFHHSHPKEKAYYLYCGKDGYLTPVLSLTQFSAMIREEVEGREALVAFIREVLPYLIFAFRGPDNAAIIDGGYFNYRKSLGPEQWNGGDSSRSQALLRKYFISKLSVDDSKWTCVFYATLSDGSIERWDVRGVIQPFTVEHCSKTPVEKPGAILPVPTVR